VAQLLVPQGNRRAMLVPILLYHSVSEQPSSHIRRFALTPDAFRRHLACIAEYRHTPLTLSDFVDRAYHGTTPLPERPVVITFDDGYADVHENALPALLEFGMPATLYVTSGYLRGRDDKTIRDPPGAMLDLVQLRELTDSGVEVGGHTHTHPQLDTVGRARAQDEIVTCKAILEDTLQLRVRSFAYPHGYSSPVVRRLVRAAGYESACGVKNAFSSLHDDPFALARLMVRDTTRLDALEKWLQGAGAPPPPRGEPVATRVWRLVRRARAQLERLHT
jgi:peptidoglycan/xylan/chitin deacetylase (PgdA/CDA1 family)